MNPIQLEQILPQPQTQEIVKVQKTGDTSFADALRAANAGSEVPSEKAEVAKVEVEHSEPETEEKLTKKTDSTEKSEKKQEKQPVDDDVKNQSLIQDLLAGNFMVSDGKIIQTVPSEPILDDLPEVKLEIAADLTSLIKSENYAESNFEENIVDDQKIDDKILNWLLASDTTTEEVKFSDDFSDLIANASEYVPGAETSDEKLASAQNLVMNDPKLFLQNIERFNEVEEKPAEFRLEDKISDEKKITQKKSGVKFSVSDLRTEKSAENISNQKILQKADAKKEFNISYEKTSNDSIQVTVDLAGKAQQEITSANGQIASAADSTFQQMLSNAVQENAPEFVKAGNIILKDNNQGTINLILHPESLGNVKISLNLNDKVISGQITVATQEAYEAFKDSIGSLKQAFADSGFSAENFDLNFSQGNQQGFAQNGNQQNKAFDFFAGRTYGEFITSKDISSEISAEEYYESSGKYSVNIVA